MRRGGQVLVLLLVLVLVLRRDVGVEVVIGGVVMRNIRPRGRVEDVVDATVVTLVAREILIWIRIRVYRPRDDATRRRPRRPEGAGVAEAEGGRGVHGPVHDHREGVE